VIDLILDKNTDHLNISNKDNTMTLFNTKTFLAAATLGLISARLSAQARP